MHGHACSTGALGLLKVRAVGPDGDESRKGKYGAGKERTADGMHELALPAIASGRPRATMVPTCCYLKGK